MTLLEELAKTAEENYSARVLRPTIRELMRRTKEELIAMTREADEKHSVVKGIPGFMLQSVGGMALVVLKEQYGHTEPEGESHKFLLLAGTLCAAHAADVPPIPPVDTNAVQVGSVTVAWDGVLGEDPAVAWYGLYSGTDSNNLVSTVIVSADETNAAVPLYAYGTNWVAATSIDASLLESDLSPAISYNLAWVPTTNVVTLMFPAEVSSDMVNWAPTNFTFTMTNPCGRQFYRAPGLRIGMQQQQ